MMKYDNITIMNAISICLKPYLKPEEAMIYCNLANTANKKWEEYGVFKNASGYYKREELDQILSGVPYETIFVRS